MGGSESTEPVHPWLNRQTIIQTGFAVARGEKLGLSRESSHQMRRIRSVAVGITAVEISDIVASLDSR